MKAREPIYRRLQRSPLLYALAAIIVYIVVVWHQLKRQLWYDEIITLYVCQLPDLKTIWKAMGEGVDFNPPFFYIVTRTAMAILGTSESAIRVPGILGYFCLCASIFTVVARRYGYGYGLAAFLLPLSFGSVYYATEARAYGLMLGCTGLAVVAWDFARSRPRAHWPLIALSFSLTGALLTHCYGVLVLFPFGLVWLLRIWNRTDKLQAASDRWDLRYAAAIVAPLVALATYFPLLAAIRPFVVDNPIFQAKWTSIIDFYQFMLAPSLTIIILWLLVAGFFVFQKRTRQQVRKPQDSELAILAIGFLIVPVLAILLAAFFTHILMIRYGLAAAIGISILFPLVTARLTAEDYRVGVVLAAVLSVYFVIPPVKNRIQRYLWPQPAIARSATPLALEAQRPDLPMVLGSGILYLEMDYYQPSARLTYLLDQEAARRYSGTDIFDKSFPIMRRWFPVRTPVESFRDFTRTRTRFLVLEIYGLELNWLIPRLRAEGNEIQLLGKSGRLALYEVNLHHKY